MTTKITMAALIVALLSGALATAAEARKFAPPPGGLRPLPTVHSCDGTIGCLPGLQCRRPIVKGPCLPVGLHSVR
jgi:hypothetical protein